MSLRSTLAGAAVALTALAAPAVAAATTYTVDPAAAAGCAGTTCKTITAANAAVADGDTVTIKAGSYTEPTITVTKSSVTFQAAEPGKVAVQTSSTAAGASTFTLGDGTGAGKGTVLKGLTVGVPATGGAAVLVQTTGTLVEASSLVRLGATADTPVYDVVDSGAGIAGGTNTLRTTFVVQLETPSAAGTAPAVRGGAETTLLLEDPVIVSGPKAGAGVLLVANDREGAAGAAIPNRITRGTILAQNPASSAVEVTSGATSAVPKATVLDSVVLAPGVSGTGLRATSVAGNALQGSTAGNVSITATHVTIAGGARPFALDAAAVSAPFLPAPLGTPAAPVGTITVTADRSIVHGTEASTVTASAGSTTTTGSTARLTLKDSDATDAAGGTAAAGTTLSGATTKSADAALFRNPGARDYHLLVAAPVVDKGGAQVGGESTLDFEGGPRVNGAATDRGADEYSNTSPVAALKADKAAIKEGESVAFDASGTMDLDGPISAYAFDFGDGSPVQQGSSATATHQFTKAGTYTVRVAAVDAGGAFAGASVQVVVMDATPPTVAVTSPKAAASTKLLAVKVTRKALAPKAGRKRTRVTTRTTRLPVTFTGTSNDAAFVELSLRRVSAAKDKRRVGTTSKVVTAKAAAATCTFLDAKAGKLTTAGCDKPVFFTVASKAGTWSYKLKGTLPVTTGSYVLTARATDAAGVVSAPVSVPFTLR